MLRLDDRKDVDDDETMPSRPFGCLWALAGFRLIGNEQSPSVYLSGAAAINARLLGR